MEWIILIGLILLCVIALPLQAYRKASQAEREVALLKQHVRRLKDRLDCLESDLASAVQPEEPPAPLVPAVEFQAEPLPPPIPDPAWNPPPLPPIPPRPTAPRPQPAALSPSRPPQLSPSKPPSKPSSPLDWERFLGVKLFSWIGGLALFLGVVFFVKYSFERDLIPPALRVGLGFATGLILLAVGPCVQRLRSYTVLTQTLSATGVVILYGVTYAAHAYYQLPAFSQTVTFLLLVLITTVAFTLAVRLNALVVAVLGMLGGFLTPLAVSTGQDRPVALFTYIALLDVGLIAVASRRPWRLLVTCAAFGTGILQWGWLSKFMETSGYAVGQRTLIPMGIAMAFILLFLGALWVQRKAAPNHRPAYGDAALLLIFSGFIMSATGCAWDSIATRPLLVYGFILLLDLAATAAAWLTPGRRMIPTIASVLIFLHLAIWSASYLTNDRLVLTMSLYVGFGLLSVVAPLLWNRWASKAEETALPVSTWLTPLALLLLSFPLVMHPTAWAGFWVPVLILNCSSLSLLSQRNGVHAQLLSALITVVMAVAWFWQLPLATASQTATVLLAGGCAAFLASASHFLIRRGDTLQTAPLHLAMAVALPFLLLILAIFRLPLDSPNVIFGAATIITLVILSLATWQRQAHAPLIAVCATLLLALVWHLVQFRPSSAGPLLVWLGAWALLFFAFPFLSVKRFTASLTEPWIAAMLAVLGLFFLMYHEISAAYGNFTEHAMGLVPAAFAGLTGIGFMIVRKLEYAEARVRNSRMAWFGGTLLFFLTAIIPAQFRREWITLGWAWEGAALIWLFRRVPHGGLRATGIALLGISFLRLALNPAVLSYHVRSGVPVWNWFLYIYGGCALAFLLAGRWLKSMRQKPRGWPWHQGLMVCAGLTLFLLVNLEIADFFAQPGQLYITLDFTNNLARDVTYSIAWGLFGLGCLVLGFWHQLRGPRYAGLLLLVITLLKLFFRDLANISSIYRIVALLGVAVIILAASFLYQRFFAKSQET